MIGRVLLAVLGLACCALAATNPVQQTALMTFYNALNGPNWHFSAAYPQGNNWGTGSACDGWSGVTCDATGTFITGLNLPGVGLSGTLPAAFGQQLPNLVTVNLASNRLTGALPVITALSAVTSMNLGFNGLTGSLGQLAQLTAVVTLSVNNNSFSGAVPPAFKNLVSLTTLYVCLCVPVGSVRRSMPREPGEYLCALLL